MPFETRRPTEEELRSALHGGPEVPSTLDADAVIRRARSHRLPRKIAFGSAAALTVAGIVLVGFTVARIPQSALMSASDNAGGAESADAPQPRDLQYEGLPAEKVNPCGGELAPVAPSENGLMLTTHFPEGAPADGRPVSGTVTLSNTGTGRVIGSTAASPVITLSRDGTVLWHSNGAMIAIAVLVDLAPGESMDYQVSLTPVACGAQDELGSGFRDNLPALPAGDYRVSALIDFVPQSADAGGHQLLGGPPQTLTLRQPAG
ncbi:MAG TPA: hypothetical protein VIQ78_01375 [Terrimesophilobacter sp.]|uniref:hypothetical protein n=1 Tax=Terrimesophilobacter sp. TaxID=2906435 RepID=UPI002F92B061